MHKNALVKGCSTLVAMVTTNACSRPGASFSYKNVAKKEWNVYFSISSEIQYYKLVLLLVTLFVFTLIHSTFQTNETCKALKECYLMSNIPKRNLASGCHLLKKIDQPSWRTTRRNYKHIPQIVCISSRFRVLYLLSWEFEQPEALWRYTVILVCHLKHVEVGWSTRNYPHTGHLS